MVIKKMQPLARVSAVIGLAMLPATGECGYGAYNHGYGIKSLGFAGIGIVMAEDTYTLAINPANAAALGSRYDVGLDIEIPDPKVTIHGNLYGADARSASRARFFPIPQAGIAFPVSDRVALGFTGFFAGVGSDYPESPYARFGGPDRVTLYVAQAGITSAVAWSVVPDQAIGAALNLGYQSLSVEGAQAFARYSSDTDHFTNQGNDPGLGYGFTIGWHGYLANWLAGAASFRSKTWAQRSHEYSGLLPDRGAFDLPAMYGAGLSWMPHPRVTVAVEYQRVLYAEQRATGNPGISAIREGRELGTKEGPGFGWNNQDIWKLGLAVKAMSTLDLRMGYSHGSQNMPAEETLLGALAPSFNRNHYTIGATWAFSPGWEVSGYFGHSPKTVLRGENSIPLVAGGGEADLQCTQYFYGLSMGRTFGDQK